MAFRVEFSQHERHEMERKKLSSYLASACKDSIFFKSWALKSSKHMTKDISSEKQHRRKLESTPSKFLFLLLPYEKKKKKLILQGRLNRLNRRQKITDIFLMKWLFQLLLYFRSVFYKNISRHDEGIHSLNSYFIFRFHFEYFTLFIAK